MQSKRKEQSKKIPTRKKTHKISLDPEDAFNTTKEKTFATIEETFQFQDHKISTRTTHYTSKRDCLDRMEANKLSPFSSPGQSLSPRPRKTFSPVVVKQKSRKKNKTTCNIQVGVKPKKSAPTQARTAKTPKNKAKLPPSKAKAEFENQFIKRMNKIEQFNNKKITELSEEEMEASIKKRSHQHPPILQLALSKRTAPPPLKIGIIRKMHQKIKQKYRKTFPKLKKNELKVLSAVVLIQRLWRQRKVKEMIGEFLSPRAFSVGQDAPTFGRNRDLGLMNEEICNTMKTEKSILSVISKNPFNNSLSVNSVSQIRQSSLDQNSEAASVTTPPKSQLNLKDLELSDDLSCRGYSQKYADMFREVVLHRKKEIRKKKSSKPNAFNFPESLSQKCLLDKLYKKSFSSLQSNGKQTRSIDVFFPHKTNDKSKQYISPKKPEVVELEQRFYTEAQDEELAHGKQTQDKVSVKPEQQTVGTIGQTAESIIMFLLNQFSEQFQAFSSKKCLKKKKKLPGIPINEATIQLYLDHFVDFVRSSYDNHIQSSFTKITPANFLKIFRILPEEDIFEQDSQDDEIEDLKVVPNTAFFQYQPLYQEAHFVIKQEHKKYSNFLSGLIKIQNKCLSDAFSEVLEKDRIDSIVFPWDSLAPNKETPKNQEIQQKIKASKKKIVDITSTKLGKLSRRDLDAEQNNLLASLRQDYQREGKDWSCHEDMLQIRLQAAELVTEAILSEFLLEFSTLF